MKYICIYYNELSVSTVLVSTGCPIFSKMRTNLKKTKPTSRERLTYLDLHVEANSGKGSFNNYVDQF